MGSKHISRGECGVECRAESMYVVQTILVI